MAKVRFQYQSPPGDCVIIQFMVFGPILSDVLETLESFRNRYDFEEPKTEVIEVQFMGTSRTHQMAGKQSPGTVTVFNKEDALLLKLKFGDQIQEGYRSDIYPMNEDCDD